MLKDYFVKQGIKEVEIEQFIRTNFPMGDYSKTELQRTPLGIKIILYTNKPGRIIGRGGKNINDMTEAIRQRFGLENPQLDVKTIRNPNLDAKIVAKQIASALERGYNHRKIGNLTLRRIMDSGAIGAQIVISGKLGGGKAMTTKFTEGYLKHCGQTAKTLVDYGYEESLVKLGKIGVKVKIMKRFMDITGEIKDKAPKEEGEAKSILEELETKERAAAEEEAEEGAGEEAGAEPSAVAKKPAKAAKAKGAKDKTKDKKK
jgi:small subunit ribosomal protein S3